MGEVVNIRDFKRKEEKQAELVRLAKEVMGLLPDTAPSEMIPYHAPDQDPA